MTTITKEQGSLQARIPVDLIRAVRIEAVRKGLHPRDIIIEALEKFLADSEKKAVKRAS